MSLAVLSDEDIRALLESLVPAEAEALAHTLKCALYNYSNSTQSTDGDCIHQPRQTTVHSKATGATTLFMPSYNASGHGVKVVTHNDGDNEDDDDDDCIDGPVVGSEEEVQAAPKTATGSLTLSNSRGQPVGLLGTQTLTAFRTALASSCLLHKRAHVRVLTVFGSGLQAYWHVRLALMFRGDTIRTVNIVARRFGRSARRILQSLYAVPVKSRVREGWGAAQFNVLTPSYTDYARLLKDHVRAADVIYCCTPSTEPLFDASLLTSHEGRRKGRLVVAVGSHAPHMRELPRELLQQAVQPHHHDHHFHKHAVEGGVVVVDTLDALRGAGEFADAGLEPKQLVELGELVMIHKAEVRDHDGEDDAGSAQRSSSEASVADIDMQGLTMTPGSTSRSSTFSSSDNADPGATSTNTSSSTSPKHSSSNIFSPGRYKRRSSHTSSDQAPPSTARRRSSTNTNHLAQWLASGNVIYKSVGLGLMDLVIGMEIVKLARERNVGHHIDKFS